MLTQSRLKECLLYDEESGLFTWIKRTGRSSRIKVGDIAGVINTWGYVLIGIDKVLYPAHRLIFLYINGSFPKEQVDHINHNRSDNRWLNLREATHVQNSRNKKMLRTNTSSFTGVYSEGKYGWRARIKINGKTKDLGTYQNFDDAVVARKQANEEYGFHPNHGV